MQLFNQHVSIRYNLIRKVVRTMTRTALIELMTWAQSHSKEQQKEMAMLITQQKEEHPDLLLRNQDIQYFIKQVS